MQLWLACPKFESEAGDWVGRSFDSTKVLLPSRWAAGAMNLLRMANVTMMDNISSKMVAVHGAESYMPQLAYESGMVFCEGWPLSRGVAGVRSEWELELAGNVGLQQDNSSSSEQTHGVQDAGAASGVKRKAGARSEGRSKEATKDSLNEKKLAKCAKVGGAGRKGTSDETKLKAERTTSEQSGDGVMSPKSKAVQELHPKQDFIHVRARRGQATDSHSLAERVRREKISERMKFLQDLVPGCSKVTGKAVMLDEIINYVQSLQRQIEFLSMKLAAIDPRLDSNLENLLNKEVVQARSPETTLMGPDLLTGHRNFQSHLQIQQQINNCNMDLRNVGTLCDAYFRCSMNLPAPAPLAYTDSLVDSLTQTVSEVSDGDLQTIVQMGNIQARQDFFGQAGIQGPGFFPTGHLKVEY